ncbi:MAG: ribonuclease D [Deltaproteobacteria bacterium]|nr:ribonuclease D [Deltaproteobacteria bacterium]
MRIKAHPKLLATHDEIKMLAQALQGHDMIALDTEFLRESTFFPIVALIQISTDDESWLVDPLAVSGEDLKPLLDVFTDSKVIKVLHAAQADQECLYTSYGVVASPTFDTAMAASLCGYGDNIGLAKLLKEGIGVTLQKGHARTDWTTRPIQEQLLRYAHLDVQYLLPLARKLLEQLDKQGRRSWALELSAKHENKANYEPNPVGQALRLAKSGKLDKRAFATLVELIAWREERVRHIDVPRRRVADDDVLVALANVRPKDMNHLGAFRGLNRGELKTSGEAILAAVKRAAQIPDSELRPVPMPDIPDARETRVIELIQCFVKLLSDELQISSRHLITPDDILPLLRKRFATVDEVVAADVMTEGSARLIGGELLAIIHGKRGLSVKDGSVRVTDL